MSYKLYTNPRTGGFIAEAGLILADAPHEVITVNHFTGGQQDPEFLKINPRGQVPALVLPDGTALSESAAMAIHLTEAFPDANLAPPLGSSGRAAFLRWIVFLSVNIYEGDLRYYYADRYTTDPEGVPAVQEAALNFTRNGLEIVEQELRSLPFLAGQSLSLADMYLAMVRLWYRGEGEFPRIAEVTDAVRTHPPIAALWNRYFQHEN